MAEAIPERRIADRMDCFLVASGLYDIARRDRFPGALPGFHLKRRMRHPERRKVHPMFWTSEPSGFREAVVQRRRRKRR